MLSDLQIKAAEPRAKEYKLYDSNGLYLAVLPTGAKSFRLRFKVDGKEKKLTIGTYPEVTLADARKASLQARSKLSEGIDPAHAKQAVIEKNREKQQAKKEEQRETVQAVAQEWFDKFKSGWVDSHSAKIIRRIERDLFPHLGKVGMSKVTPAQLLAVVRRVEARGTLETAHRLLQNCGQVWRYGVATGRAERDITADLRGALPPTRQTHLGAITDTQEVGNLLRNIDEYKGSEVVRAALKLAPLTFVRPGELRQARWDEFDLDGALWVIPAGRMKAKRQHIVPLSFQALAVLGELRKTHESEYLFPSPLTLVRCISDVALLAALRRMGYTKEEMTAHGFRSMASTNLEQLGYDVRIIELQLAHADQNEVRAAYKRDTSRLQLAERSKMMQNWADYLDGLRNGAQVLAFRGAKG